MSAPANFVSNRIAELPAFLGGSQGRAWATGMGTVQNDQIPLLRVAALARLPLYCPDDALDAVGAWLLLPRFPGEIDGSSTPPSGYRGRLINAWTTWYYAGSKQAIITSLQGYGIPDVAVDNDYEVSPPWDGSWYTRFRVRLGPDFGTYGWGVGNDPTAAQKAQIQRQVLFWKWAYSYPVDVVLDYGGGDSFTFYIGPLIGYGFIIDVDTIGGFHPI